MEQDFEYLQCLPFFCFEKQRLFAFNREDARSGALTFHTTSGCVLGRTPIRSFYVLLIPPHHIKWCVFNSSHSHSSHSANAFIGKIGIGKQISLELATMLLVNEWW